MRALAALRSQHKWHLTDVDELDISDEQAVHHYVAGNRIELIVNCAAYTDVEKAEVYPSKAYILNRDAPGYLADAARENGAAIIHISTDYVFNGETCLPYDENEDPDPRSVYGKSKEHGERQVREKCEQAMIIRTSWLYSAHGNNFVKTMLRLGRERDNIDVVFDQVGTPTYASDLMRVIGVIIECGIQPGTYHFSDEGVCSWYDFAMAIFRMAGITNCQVSPIHSSEYRAHAPRPFYAVLDKTKIKTAYGIQIPHWENSLRRCLANMQI
jgi:dTDP-4-dehydrorhamnose reductase